MGYNAAELKSILKQVEEGRIVDQSLLLPYLTLESKADRYQINLELAGAYYRRYELSQDAKALGYARACIDRAFLLSHYSAGVLPLFIKINRALNDIAAIEEGFKRVAIEQAAQGNFQSALQLIDRWAFTNAEFTKIDTHRFDPDVLACVERMGALHRFEPVLDVDSDARKIRIAYLMQGLIETNSVLIKIDKTFARFHDKSRFDIAYFAVNDEAVVEESHDAQTAIREIGECGWSVQTAPRSDPLYGQLLSIARKIYEFRPDILITSGALATFKNYFVSSLKPAPVAIAFNQGPSPQFTWHTFDHSISWFKTNIPDCPAECSYVPLEFDFDHLSGALPATRAELEIPETATLAVSGGRWPKFQEPRFWRALAELLEEHENLYWVMVGFGKEQIPFLDNIFSAGLLQRVRFRPWSRDYVGVMAAADFVVDSYPVGGGVFLMEAMALSRPVLSFRHDYVAPFSNNDCSGCDELVGIPELMINRGDFDSLKTHVTSLIRDADLRRRLGEQCRQQIRETRGEAARMVKRCEQIYERVLREARSNPMRVQVIKPDVDEQRRLLIEQAEVLNKRETELSRREALVNGRPLAKVVRSVRVRLHRLRYGDRI